MIHHRAVMAQIIVAALLVGCSCTSDASAKVGYIDLKRLVRDSSMGKEARKQIQALSQEKEKAAFEKLQKIKQLKSELDEQNALLTENKKRDKLQQLQNLNKDYKRFIADSKEEIAQKDRDLVALILKNAEQIIKTIAKKGRYTLILKDPNVLGYLDPEVDITNNVLKRMDAQMKNGHFKISKSEKP
ncbi:MAG: OmpH family outer membrane protein [Thermodesulfobacteriota bacterium]|nr:OmpH family outer membrane protein [Thermodesulfobacteriota bacterium]